MSLAVIIPILIPFLLFGILFFLCDDWREYVQLVKSEWKAFVIVLPLIFIPVIIYIQYPIYIMTGVLNRSAELTLWNPYIFGGMPSYALVIGYRGFDALWVFQVTTITVIFGSPFGVALFVLSIWWFFRKKNVYKYLLILFCEFIMLYSAFWNTVVKDAMIKGLI